MAKGKRYDAATKERALALSDEIGNAKAAEQLGINICTIDRWRWLRNKKNAEIKAKKEKWIIKPNAEELKKAVEKNPFVTIETKDDEPPAPLTFKRGEVYYIYNRLVQGDEMISGRPAVIVSNDRINDLCGVVEVVMMTTKSKAPAPERIEIKATGTRSTLLCEQITTIDKSRIGDFIGECTPEEMAAINRALISSLSLSETIKSPSLSDDEVLVRVNGIKAERDAYKEIYERLFDRYCEKIRKE